MFSRLKKEADKLNLPVQENLMVYNSRWATELSKWAEEQGRGDAFHHEIFHAYFAEGLNISKVPVLQKICSRLDLDPLEALRILLEKPYKQIVDADWRYASSCGVKAVPTFSMNDRLLVGAQPYSKLEQLVTSARDQGNRILH